MLQQKLLSLPHLQEQHGPDGHDSREEHGPRVVEQVVEAHAEALVLKVREVTLLVTGGAHVEGQVVRGPSVTTVVVHGSGLFTGVSTTGGGRI